MIKYVTTACVLAIALMGCKGKKAENVEQTDRTNMTNNQMYMLVGTYTSGESKGVYVYKIDTVTGTSEYVSMVEVANPSYLTLSKDEKFVYAVTEDDGAETSAANAFSFDKESGKLIFLNKQLTQGGAPCYINVDANGKHIVTANYVGANVTVFPVKENGSLDTASQVVRFEGKGSHPKRQQQPHIHCVQYSPDGKYLFVDDLGTDRIHKFNVNQSGDYLTAGTLAAFRLKPGSGPRHLDFHPNGKYGYLINEISGDVVVFDYKEGNLSQLQSIKADTLDAQGSGDIHVSPDGRFVYASNRLKGDGIVVFSINQETGELTKLGYQATGIHPRNFAITPNGKLLLVANRDSNNIQVFKIDVISGLLQDTGHTIKLNMPVCIKFASLE